MLSYRVRSVMRTTAMVATIGLVLLNFMIPVVGTPSPIPDGPFIDLGEQYSGIFRTSYPPWDYWDIFCYRIIIPSYYHITAVQVDGVFTAERTLMWEDVRVDVVSRNGKEGAGGLPVSPLTIPIEDVQADDDTGILAFYENHKIMHGHVYKGDTFYLVNVPDDLNGAQVTISIDGETLASYQLKVWTLDLWSFLGGSDGHFRR
jgi:hypothetical protein